MDEVTSWAPYEDLLKSEGEAKVVPDFGIIIVSYFDEDGHKRTRWHIDGDADPNSLLGVIERVKFCIQVENLDFIAFAANGEAMDPADEEIGFDGEDDEEDDED